MGVDVSSIGDRFIEEIAVSGDKELENYQAKQNRDYYEPIHEVNNTPAVLVASDMLSFLKRLPDNSVSVYCSGIDKTIISNKEHRLEIGKEIARVLHPKGGYIGGSDHIEIPKTQGVGNYVLFGTGDFSSMTYYNKVSTERPFIDYNEV